MDRTMTGFISALVLAVVLMCAQAASGWPVEVVGSLKIRGADSGVIFSDLSKQDSAVPTVRDANGQYLGLLLGLQRDVNSLEIYVPLLKRVAVLRTSAGHLAGANLYYSSPKCDGTAHSASYWSYAMFRNSGKNYGGDTMSPLLVPDNFICQSYQPSDGSACVDSMTECPSGVVTVHEITSPPLFTVPVARPLVLE